MHVRYSDENHVLQKVDVKLTRGNKEVNKPLCVSEGGGGLPPRDAPFHGR